MPGYAISPSTVVTPMGNGFITPSGNVILPGGGGGFISPTGNFIQTH